MTPMNPRDKHHGKMSITTRFGLGIGLLLTLIVTVAATGWLSMRYIRHAETAIRTSNDILGLVLEMDRGLEKARRLHGDFFLQYPGSASTRPTNNTRNPPSGKSPGSSAPAMP